VGDTIALHGLLWPDEVRAPDGLAPGADVVVRADERPYVRARGRWSIRWRAVRRRLRWGGVIVVREPGRQGFAAG
ncbi:hypothetical protein ABT269_32405, partial [Streptomyces viridosporus]